MVFLGRAGRRVVAGALSAGAVTAALTSSMLFGTLPSALADEPPNCTAADLAGVAAGVSASTSAYLFTHPEVNTFFTGLKGQPREQTATAVKKYFEQNPTTRDELRGIRQPLTDLKARCGDAGAPGPMR